MKFRELYKCFLEDLKGTLAKGRCIIDCRLIHKGTIRSISVSFNSCFCKFDDLLEDLVAEYKEKFERSGYKLLCEFRVYDKKRAEYELYIKKLRGKRVEPEAVLYHYSPSVNRKSIEKNGLICKDYESSRWADTFGYYYDPAIFLGSYLGDLGFITLDSGGIERSFDLWMIDVSKTKNKWYEDCNIPHEKIYFMTYENISPEALTLVETNVK